MFRVGYHRRQGLLRLLRQGHLQVHLQDLIQHWEERRQDSHWQNQRPLGTFQSP